MGCGSQTGCLGPKPREREVYLDLVDTIHQEALILQLPQKEDPYAFVKGHLTKKGLLRKLIDNLVSHKTNLYECASQLLDITTAASQLSQCVASLVVVDKIIDEFFKQPQQPDSKEKEIKRSVKNQILPAVLAYALPAYGEVPVDIMQRMNVVYFKMVIGLMEKDKALKKYVLASLTNFLSLKSDKLLCKAQIFRIFELLIDNLKSKVYVKESTQIFAQMLSRIKQNTCKEVNEDYVLFFIRSWFFNKESQQVTDGYRKVLKELINTYCGNTDLLVKEFTVVLDEVHFQQRQSAKIEELILYSLDSQDSSHNLIRSLAVNIIKYLQIGSDDNVEFSSTKFKNCESEKCILNGFKLITRWILERHININSIIEYNPSSMVNFYVSSHEKGPSESFKYELKQQYFKIIESLSPESVITLTNLLAELMKDKIITKQRREAYYSLFQEILKTRSALLRDDDFNYRIRLVLSLQRHYHKEMKFELLSFAAKGIKYWNVLKIKTNHEAIEIFRLRICEFLYSIFDLMVNNFENKEMNSEKSLTSSDENSKKPSRIANLHKLTVQALKVIKVLNEHHLQAYLLVFLENISQYLQELNSEDDKEAIILYFLAYLVQQSLFIMNKKERVSEPLLKMSIKLDKEHFVQDFRSQIIQTAQALLHLTDTLPILGEADTVQYPDLPHSKTHRLTEKYQMKTNATRQLFLIQQVEWNDIADTFKLYFGENARDSRAKFQNQVFAERDFNRMSSLNVSLNDIDNEKGSTRHQGQQSFREIMDKLHQH